MSVSHQFDRMGYLFVQPFSLLIRNFGNNSKRRQSRQLFYIFWSFDSVIQVFKEEGQPHAEEEPDDGGEKKIKLFAYVFCGFCAGVAGLIGTSNISTSDATSMGLNLELDAILAVVIGGTLLGTGGRFSLLGSIIGALVMQAVTTSMYAIGVSANSLLAVKGVVVILLILLYSQQVQDFIRKITGQTRLKEAKS